MIIGIMSLNIMIFSIKTLNKTTLSTMLNSA
jgi:hypothetical protein